MQKGQRVEGLLIKNGKVQGGMGKIALLLPLSHDQNRGGERAAPAAWACGPGGSVAVRGVGEKGEGATGSRFPAASRAGVVRGSLATAAGGGGRRRLWRQHCKARRRPGAGEKARGSPGDPIPPLTLGDGGLWTAPHGGGRSSAVMVVAAALESSRRAVRRRCELWWWWVALGPFYRR